MVCWYWDIPPSKQFHKILSITSWVLANFAEFYLSHNVKISWKFPRSGSSSGYFQNLILIYLSKCTSLVKFILRSQKWFVCGIANRQTGKRWIIISCCTNFERNLSCRGTTAHLSRISDLQQSSVPNLGMWGPVRWKCGHRPWRHRPEWTLTKAVVITTIRLRFDGRSTAVRLLVKGH